MWTRYRRFKHAVAFPLVIVALVLMRGEPELSPAWNAGLGIAMCLAVAYLGEEITWMVLNRGRPCSRCGRKIQVAPFAVGVRCPHCGHSE